MVKKFNAKWAALVELLSDGQTHDGNVLGEQLGITRSAVWKMCQKLQSLGVPLQSVKGKGYMMPTPLRLLDPFRIQAGIPSSVKVEVLESTASTNDYLLAGRTQSGVSVCLAEMQTAGRGRLGRPWVSPFGENIYFSCQYPFQKDISELAGLSLVVSLSIVAALKQIGVHETLAVKWPNDVVCEAGKLSGTLIELRAESNGHCEAVIGIGINVNMTAARGIDQAWTSLYQQCGQSFDRNAIVIALVNQLLDDLALFQREGLPVFLPRWNALDFYRGKSVHLQQATSLIAGVAQGVNEHGHLLLELPDGTVKSYASGDASLRGNHAR